MHAKFYKYTKQEILFNKSYYLDELTAKSFDTVQVAGDQDIEKPVLTVYGTGTYGLNEFTYCYIQEWNRYYFIVNRRWLADDAYQISLAEDYIYSAKTLLEVQSGFVRYSGLGNKALTDNRIQLKREATTEMTTYTPPGGSFKPCVVMKYITCQTDTLGTNATAEAVAIMNERAWYNFIYNYYTGATTEAQKVVIGRYIVDIAYVPYMNINSYVPGVIPPTPPPSTTYIRFAIPDADSPVMTDIDISAGLFNTGAECWVIPNMFNIDAWLDAARGLAFDASNLNSGGQFWKLDGKWILKIPTLDPITIVPESLGVTGAFRLKAYVQYEPFTAEYIITLGTAAADEPGTSDRFKWQQIKQRNKLHFTFVSDAAQNQTTLKTIGTIMNIIGAGINSIATENAAPILSAGSNAIMTTYQNRLDEQLSFSVSKSDSGSIDFAAAGVRTPTLYNVYNAPETGYGSYWNNKGIPDNTWRTILSLANTGYAEVDIVDIVDNIFYFTSNELASIRERMSAGVIFNEDPNA